ncbi:MAG: hypothetical protein IPQ05_14480 [Leptospiraceae bacterium]|nr:hypothetical protein [Leptospiraceae bacterium]
MEQINFKLIADTCTDILKQTVQDTNIFDIEIEEFSSNNSEIYITIGYSRNRFVGVDDGNPYPDPNDFIEVRKYRTFTFDRSSLEFISMGIREMNPRQNKYGRVPTTIQA